MEPDRQHRLDEVARIAVDLEKSTGVPALLTVTQWAIESQWGAKPVGNNNFFGIKKADRHTQCCTVTTHEVLEGRRIRVEQRFADYNSLEDSCADYAWLISHGDPYREAWNRFKEHGLAWNLLVGVAYAYATDPNYIGLATKVASEPTVILALKDAYGATA